MGLLRGRAVPMETAILFGSGVRHLMDQHRRQGAGREVPATFGRGVGFRAMVRQDWRYRIHRFVLNACRLYVASHVT